MGLVNAIDETSFLIGVKLVAHGDSRGVRRARDLHGVATSALCAHRFVPLLDPKLLNTRERFGACELDWLDISTKTAKDEERENEGPQAAADEYS